MRLPAGFVKWRGYWFQCPHCSHRAYTAYGLVGMAQDGHTLVWRFWCPACEKYSQPARPGLARAMIGVALVLLFVGLAGPVILVFSGSSPGLAMWWVVMGAAMAFIAVPLLMRLTNGYRPA